MENPTDKGTATAKAIAQAMLKGAEVQLLDAKNTSNSEMFFNYKNAVPAGTFHIEMDSAMILKPKPGKVPSKRSWVGETLVEVVHSKAKKSIMITLERIYGLLEASGIPKGRWFINESGYVTKPQKGVNYKFAHTLLMAINPVEGSNSDVTFSELVS